MIFIPQKGNNLGVLWNQILFPMRRLKIIGEDLNVKIAFSLFVLRKLDSMYLLQYSIKGVCLAFHRLYFLLLLTTFLFLTKDD